MDGCVCVPWCKSHTDKCRPHYLLFSVRWWFECAFIVTQLLFVFVVVFFLSFHSIDITTAVEYYGNLHRKVSSAKLMIYGMWHVHKCVSENLRRH